MKRLVLIDGNALLHRAYHAMPKLTTSSGQVVNAVYGFTNMLFRVFGDLKPDYVVVSFDRKAPTFRHKEFDGYKAKRPKMDDDLVSQIGPVHEVVEGLNIPIFEVDGFEADDVIGTLATQAERAGVETVVVTGDRDALQLVNDNVKVWCPKKGLSDPILYDEAEVRKKYGFRPGQLADFKGLRGDPSDNIPGVNGIGEVSAKKLIEEYGDLESIYEHVDEIEGKVGEKLREGKEDAFMSKRLGEIVLDVPIELDLEKCVLSDYDRERAVEVFKKYEFRRLIDRLPFNVNDFKKEKEKVEIENQLGLF